MTAGTSSKQPHSGAATVLPRANEKHAYVRAMFDAIAPRYDLLNSLLSGPLHHHWRRVAADQATLSSGDLVFDNCSGTGDLALEMARRVGPVGSVVGGDFSLPMLRLGWSKAQRGRASAGAVRMLLADAQNLPFADNTFDAAAVSFGIRNVSDIEKGVVEMARVVCGGGRVVILEFNQPPHPVIAALYRLYSFNVLPLLGGLISRRRAAYKYLPSSVAAFHKREAITAMMERAGLESVCVTNLTLGTVVIHRGIKAG